MRLLADESCDFSVVRGLRIADHDVLSITETLAGATDERVMALAVGERRLLLTEDKEFGQLVYAAASRHARRLAVQQFRRHGTGSR